MRKREHGTQLHYAKGLCMLDAGQTRMRHSSTIKACVRGFTRSPITENLQCVCADLACRLLAHVLGSAHA